MQAQQIPQQTDPNLTAEQAQAQQDQITTLQTQATGDTASIMARYGTRLALAGTAGTSSPATPAPAQTTPAAVIAAAGARGPLIGSLFGNAR